MIAAYPSLETEDAMKAFKIDVDGVTEIDVPDDFLDSTAQLWDKFDLDARHDVWVDDEGLLSDVVELARVGPNPNTPLPAYVLGSNGERVCGADLSLEHVQALVTIRGSHRVTLGLGED